MTDRIPQPGKKDFNIIEKVLGLIKREYPDCLTYTQIKTRIGYNPGLHLKILTEDGLIERMEGRGKGYRFIKIKEMIS